MWSVHKKLYVLQKILYIKIVIVWEKACGVLIVQIEPVLEDISQNCYPDISS